jgi:hypothetical protein
MTTETKIQEDEIDGKLPPAFKLLVEFCRERGVGLGEKSIELEENKKKRMTAVKECDAPIAAGAGGVATGHGSKRAGD